MPTVGAFARSGSAEVRMRSCKRNHDSNSSRFSQVVVVLLPYASASNNTGLNLHIRSVLFFNRRLHLLYVQTADHSSYLHSRLTFDLLPSKCSLHKLLTEPQAQGVLWLKAESLNLVNCRRQRSGWWLLGIAFDLVVTSLYLVMLLIAALCVHSIFR